MKSITLVSDPVAAGASVQFNILGMLVRYLDKYDSVTIITPYMPHYRKDLLSQNRNTGVVTITESSGKTHFIFNIFKKNESMLWAISWLMEGLFSTNSENAGKIIGNSGGGHVLNLSYTVPAKCDLFWNQATPPLVTLNLMGRTNILARMVHLVMRPIFSLLDGKIMRKHTSMSTGFAHNSRYLKELYASLGYQAETVLHTPKVFSEFLTPDEPPARDYVLAYIGKEVEVDTIATLADMGIRVVAFGAKIPYGTSIARLKEKTEFMGYVSEEQLSSLYYNALFTAFPFTEEPFGWVPLESMQHGTPVLSYNRQGPSETIIDRRTGWLVGTRDEFITKAKEIWTSKDTGLQPHDCRERVMEFSCSNTIDALQKLLEAPNEL